MRTSVFTWLAAASLAVIAAFTPIQPAAGQIPVSGGHFRRALSSDPANLDPALTNTSRAIAVKMTIFDSLLRQNPKTLAIEPGAAEGPHVHPRLLLAVHRAHRRG